MNTYTVDMEIDYKNIVYGDNLGILLSISIDSVHLSYMRVHANYNEKNDG